MNPRTRIIVIASIAALVVILGAGIALLVTSSTHSDGPAETAETTTTTTIALPVWPLTGLPDPAAGVFPHPAISVKMDNSSDARPQTGINEADVVFELLVEGITRFALVFHSKLPDPVGPVRSARSSDPQIVHQLSRPLFAWSGGNAGVVEEIAVAARAGILTDASYSRAQGSYFRSNDRYAPHNLYVKLPQLLAEMAPPGQGDPAPLFVYRPVQGTAATTTTTTTSIAGDGATTTTAPGAGAAVAGFSLEMDGTTPDWVWDGSVGGWRRFQVDGGHDRPNSATIDPAGRQVAPANIVVMFIDYGSSPSDPRSPMAITVGSGPLLVFRNGSVISGTWRRPDAAFPAALTDQDGRTIELTAGRTWVEFPRKGAKVSLMDRAGADSLLQFAR